MGMSFLFFTMPDLFLCDLRFMSIAFDFHIDEVYLMCWPPLMSNITPVR